MFIKQNSLLQYLKMDFYRSLFSWQFLIGIFGVVCIMFLAIFENNQLDTSVLYVYAMVVYGLPFMTVHIMCAFPYATSFCEDWENKYFHLEVVRGKLGYYICSKVVVIFLTSVLTLVIGSMIFVCVLHLFLPWIMQQDSIYMGYLETGGLTQFLRSQNFILFFLLSSVQYGLLSGILALLASYVSLFISNKLLILAVPAIGYYFIENFMSVLLGKNTFDLILLFDSSYSLFSNDLLSYIFSVGISILSVVIFNFLIYKRIKGRMQNE